MKSFILYLDGICDDVNDQQQTTTATTRLERFDHPFMDQLTLNGITTKLHLRNNNNNNNKNNESMSVNHMKQLLNIVDDNNKQSSSPMISDKYHKMKFKLFTNDSQVYHEMIKYESHVELLLNNIDSTTTATATTSTTLSDQFDVIYKNHNNNNNNNNNNNKNHRTNDEQEQQEWDTIMFHINFDLIDNQMECIKQLDQSMMNNTNNTSSSSSSSLLKIIIASYHHHHHHTTTSTTSTTSTSSNNNNNNSCHDQSALSLLYRPIQSYTWKESHDLNGQISSHHPMYCIWHHNTSTRRDYNEQLTEKACESRAGHGSILADHFFGELAYKMCFSDKYGA